MSIKDSELVNDFTFEDLLKAYYECRKRKRNTYSALKFEVELEKNLLKLYRDLKTGNYKIGRYICFVVTSPKPREVWAANFRDRIVHHLVYNAIKDRFYKRFIKDTYSCIPKRGTLACARKMLKYARAASHNYKVKTYFLKADLSNFFVSIDKKILFKLLTKYVKEKWIVDLLKLIVFHDPRKNVYIKSNDKIFKLLPPHKSLWNNKNSNGLPIGNLTSQFFSNVYLDVLDQYVKHHLRCKFYCRYVDDFVILSYSSYELACFVKMLSKYLESELKLILNPKKCFINNITKGIDFVGFFIKPHRLLIRKSTIYKIKLLLEKWKINPLRFEMPYIVDFLFSVNSYLGIVKHTLSFNFRYKFCLNFNSLFIFPNLRFSKAVLVY